MRFERAGPRRRGLLPLAVALAIGGSVSAAAAEDFFRLLPALARALGTVRQPLPIRVPPGVPISTSLPPGGEPPSDRFKAPASTAGAAAGRDPFTGRPLPPPAN